MQLGFLGFAYVYSDFRYRKSVVRVRVALRLAARICRRLGPLHAPFAISCKGRSNKDRRADQRSPENGSDKMSATEVGGRTERRMPGGRLGSLSTLPSSSLPATGNW